METNVEDNVRLSYVHSAWAIRNTNYLSGKEFERIHF